jgi:hypothetical protein
MDVGRHRNVVSLVYVPEVGVIGCDQELMVEVLLQPALEGLQAAEVYDPVTDV